MSDPLHKRILDGEPLAGTVLTLPGPTAAELLSEPFDLIWIDLEHAALGPFEAQEMIIGVQAAGAHALVRLPAHAQSLMVAALDAGVDGIVIADVDDPAAIAEVVDRIKHPPDGNRGWGPRRLALRHRTKESPASTPSVWAQIESQKGVEHVQQIASVPGLDVLCVGTADLSFSLGTPLELAASQLLDAVHVVRGACTEAGVAFGLAGALDVAPRNLLEGASILIHSTDAKLCAQAVDAAAAWLRGILESEQEPSAS